MCMCVVADRCCVVAICVQLCWGRPAAGSRCCQLRRDWTFAYCDTQYTCVYLIRMCLTPVCRAAFGVGPGIDGVLVEPGMLVGSCGIAPYVRKRSLSIVVHTRLWGYSRTTTTKYLVWSVRRCKVSLPGFAVGVASVFRLFRADDVREFFKKVFYIMYSCWISDWWRLRCRNGLRASPERPMYRWCTISGDRDVVYGCVLLRWLCLNPFSRNGVT